MYRIYEQNKVYGWELIDTKTDLKEAYKIAARLKPKEYYSYLIVVNKGMRDEIVDRKDLSKECKVEYVNEVQKKYEVRAVTFKPSRMKRKQEERKMFEQYIDR